FSDSKLPGQESSGPQSLAKVSRSLWPARCSGCFLHLSDLRPACFLGERNSPAPGCGKNTFGAMWLPRVCCGARTSGKLLQNRNSFPKFLDLVLRIPAFLAEPDQCLNDVCHPIPPRVTSVGHCITKSQVLSEFIAGRLGITWTRDTQPHPIDGRSPDDPNRKSAPTARL